jgi:uncharacterized protein (DUF488 family)
MNSFTIKTIGHSTHPIATFLEILAAHGVRHIVDVRLLPGSRRHPQFNQENLQRSLSDASIGYTHLKSLGGRRKALPDSPNIGWKNASFRGYADYMQTPEFENGLTRLLEIAKHEMVAILCAEAVPWRCHRSLIADALLARGVSVEHLLSLRAARPHELTAFAKIEGTRVTYPGIPKEELTLF